MYTNATVKQLNIALNEVNLKYNDNITWNRFEIIGKHVFFTLKVIDAHGVGAGLGLPHNWLTRNGKQYKQRHLSSACWHVHGDLFDALFKINKDAYVMARGRAITAYEGNWVDWERGSRLNPINQSSLCECPNYEEKLRIAGEELEKLSISIYY